MYLTTTMVIATIALLFLTCLQVTRGQESSSTPHSITYFEDEISARFANGSEIPDPYRGPSSEDPRKLPDSYGGQDVKEVDNHFCSDYSGYCWKWCHESAGTLGDKYCYISPYTNRKWIKCAKHEDCLPWKCVSECYSG